MAALSVLDTGMDWPVMDERPAFVHRPVLLDEVVGLFADAPPGFIVDATLGAGGHAAALAQSDPDRQVIGIDRDPDALVSATHRFATDADLTGRLTTIRARFDDGLDLIDTDTRVAGVLFDLGVSSPQFDRANRGFSYRGDAPLDMRMDPDAPISAADLLAERTENEIATLLREFGDERFATRIARAIVTARPVTTTGQLVQIIAEAVPAPARRHGGHPAKRTFQALRIAVNGELDALRAALPRALDLVVPGGRVAVISYHSGEDRISKSVMRDAITGGCECPVGLPCVCGAVPRARNLTRGGLTPTPAEVAENRRAASARLRAVEVLG